MLENAETLIALLWDEPVLPKRGPKPTLTLERIARVGIEVADADGLAAVTMQRVAENLGVTKMALYRYVPGKAELVALMLDFGVGKPPKRRNTANAWRAALNAWSRQLFTRFCEHPWALEATLGVRIMGPNETEWLEQALATLAGTQLTPQEMLDVVVTLLGHIRNLAQQVTAIDMPEPEQAMEKALSAVVEGRTDRFPMLTAVLRSARGAGRPNVALEFGLDRILDGVALLMEKRARG